LHWITVATHDPPNFGWSDRLPSDLEDFFEYFNPLLESLGRKDEEMILVGWGGGAENALMHAIANRNTTNVLVIMDASPDGIEWLDAKRKNNWTEAEMMNYRSTDLGGRVFLAETIVGLGLPWYVTSAKFKMREFALLTMDRGLMPVFNQSLYPRHRAQCMKEDMWAYQYYSLIQQASTSIDNYLVNTTCRHESLRSHDIRCWKSNKRRCQ
jgi:pimeloyl-ACP methyl ester carboxylesterase